MSEPINKGKNYLAYILVGIIVIGAFFLGQSYNRIKTLEKQVLGKQAAGEEAPSVPPKADVKVEESDPQQGEKKAKVTIVEFADFQCPFCGAFAGLNQEVIKVMQQRFPGWTEAIPGIIKDYVKTGKARLVWKDYPFLGQESLFAAASARCAAEQGKFWEFHDYLFSHQKGENEGTFSKDNLKKFAATLKLKTADFNTCLDSGKYESKMQDALKYGQSVGVNGTPATVINGKLYSGALSYEELKKAIEEELKK